MADKVQELQKVGRAQLKTHEQGERTVCFP